eukprot:CAMPEP_0184864026 /NCGR_PEP_ID=MMETSP0580-20130426/13422_1 /TAXON_ID=1118495 /ORGANISM="Dactyliosolen fragilissimus" /LENGTH=874 /DNA_ID=CAMNT_0027362653 /DNA_START=462 /DNA_END=3086 /DNA_ORIENTATION=-
MTLRSLYDIIDLETKEGFFMKDNTSSDKNFFVHPCGYSSKLYEETFKSIGLVAYLSCNNKGLRDPESSPKITNNCLGSLVPIPLTSITLHLSEKDQRVLDLGEQRKTLLQTCIKRQLVGTVVAFDNNKNLECSLTLPLFPDWNGIRERLSKSITLTISSAIPSRSDYSPRNAVMANSVHIILPSTRITILKVHNDDHKNYQILQKSEELERSRENVVGSEISNHNSITRLLRETLTAIRIYSNYVHSRQYTNIFQHEKCKYHLVDVPRTFLLVGPPGVGKTFSIRTAVKMIDESNHQDRESCQTKLLSVRGSEILSLGASETDAAIELKKIFFSAVRFCSKNSNHLCVIFMDECDALFSSDVLCATIASLLDKMCLRTNMGLETHVIEEGINKNYNLTDETFQFEDAWNRLVVVGATNKVDSIPVWLKRPGRFDFEVTITPPNIDQRLKILKSLLTPQGHSRSESKASPDSCTSPSNSNPNISNGKDEAYTNEEGLYSIAEACVGYVAADLMSLVRKSGLLAIDKGRKIICLDDLSEAMNDISASALRDATISAPPKTSWDDIAGDAGGAKTALRCAIEWPYTKKMEFDLLGLVPPRGILLHGPPGCAKTTLARAAAAASGVSFFSLSPADVYASSYVGEAESIVRQAFNLARSAAPCILFFDEIDSILGSLPDDSRNIGMGRGSETGTTAEARVLSTFLNEMDGVDGSIKDGVLVLGATNRPSTLDAALLRPGRFDKVIYVPPPDFEGRKSILIAQIRRWKQQETHETGIIFDEFKDIDIDYLACEEVSGLMTGAEIVGACQEAAMIVLREYLQDAKLNSEDSFPERKSKLLRSNIAQVHQMHLIQAFRAVKPLLSNQDVLFEYERFEKMNST